jgi:hypothetical protein
MPSSSSRSRVPTRRSPRPAPRAGIAAAVPERPLIVPFAAVFGLLVGLVNGYLAWLMWTPEVGLDWLMVVPALLAVLAVVAAAAVFWGRRPGWALLAAAAGLTLLAVLALAVLFALLGGGQAFWSAVLLLVAPVVALSLALRRPVREWTGRAAANRSPGGRRAAGSAR